MFFMSLSSLIHKIHFRLLFRTSTNREQIYEMVCKVTFSKSFYKISQKFIAIKSYE